MAIDVVDDLSILRFVTNPHTFNPSNVPPDRNKCQSVLIKEKKNY